jgi:signal transduction histidine kinase
MKINFVIRITLIYLFIGIGWIIFSDLLLQNRIYDIKDLSVFQSLKGILFVILTAVVIFFLSLHYMRNQKRIHDRLMKAKNNAEENNRLKTAFLANLSHEIRTPMNGIMGFINLLEDPDFRAGKFDSYLDLVKKSSERMLETISNIIEISRIESEEIPVYNSGVDINEILNELYRVYQPAAKEKGLKLILNLKINNGKCIIHTDKNKLITILRNLLKNALKFTKEGMIEFGFQQKDENGLFYVKDTGLGIPEDWHTLIFERFAQVDSTLTSQYEGLGLGLPIAHFYADLLGGRLWVESLENSGSIFWLSIPIK